MMLENNLFALRGIVSYTGPKSPRSRSTGHYVAYGYRAESDLWEKFNDLANSGKSSRVRKNAMVRCHAIFYTKELL